MGIYTTIFKELERIESIKKKELEKENVDEETITFKELRSLTAVIASEIEELSDEFNKKFRSLE